MIHTRPKIGFKEVNAGDEKIVTIAPGIPVTKEGKTLGFALIVVQEEGETGPTLVHPLDSAEDAAMFLLGLTQGATMVFGAELETAMAALSSSQDASDASSDGVAH